MKVFSKQTSPLFLHRDSSQSHQRRHSIKPWALAAALVALGALQARAQFPQTFTNADANGAYNDNNNWSLGFVPDPSTGDTATINDGVAVSYSGTVGGDLIISNGGELQITSGSFTQSAGNNYIQLGAQGRGTATGNGTILVNGGTFTQGTASSTPFNITGTGNLFEITSGAANFDQSFNMNVGFTYMQTGGAVVVATGNETDFNGGSVTLAGGSFTTRLVTGINGGGSGVSPRTFNISGGMLNLGTATDSTYIYAGNNTEYVNFTLNSTGSIHLNNPTATIGTADGFITGGGIEYNNTVAPTSDFNVTQDPNTGYVTIALIPGLQGVPEPSVIVWMGLGVAGLTGWTMRRSKGRSVA